MSKLTVSRPHHSGCTLKYQSSTDGGVTFSALEDITESFLLDKTKTHTGSVSGRTSLSDDLLEVDRFLIYYESAQPLDKIFLSGLTQESGLSFKVFGEDVSLDEIPTTQIGSTISQVVAARPRRTSNQLLTFTEESKTCFMVERHGIESHDGGHGLNLMVNGGFESGDLTGWSSTGSTGTITTGDFTYGTTGESPDALFQSIDIGSSDLSLSFYYVSENASQLTNPSLIITGAVAGVYTTSQSTDGGRTRLDFDVLSTETSIEIKFLNNGVYDGYDDPDVRANIARCELVVNSGSAYTGSPVDTRAIFFGQETYQPDYNFSYGGSFDNFHKYNTTKTQSSNYQEKIDSTRVDNLVLDNQSLIAIEDLEYLDYQLDNGYCFYQRDDSSVDPSSFFLANFTHGSRKNNHASANSATVTFKESHEWR